MDPFANVGLRVNPNAVIPDPDDRLARGIAEKVISDLAQDGRFSSFTMDMLLRTLSRLPGEKLAVIFEGGTGGAPLLGRGQEPDDRIPREIARMVLKDIASTGRLSPSTADTLLMTVSRQPGQPPAILFGSQK